jgi:hypothetical protein
MAPNRRFHQHKRAGGRFAPETRSLQRPPAFVERQAPVVYGKPFIVMEDEQKNTFIFKAGTWVAHSSSIAECRQSCQVKQLAQRVNGMIRYEIRCPEGTPS